MASYEVVLIGASAGGIEPLMEILSALPADLPASIFIAQHIAPNAERTLVNLLQKNRKLEVKYPVDEEFYRSAVAYLAPPGNHMLISNYKIWVFRPILSICPSQT